MAESTLSAVIAKLASEGDLNRNTGTNSIKSLKSEVNSNSDKISGGISALGEIQSVASIKLESLIDFMMQDKLKAKETDREDKQYNAKLLEAIQKIGGPQVAPAASTPSQSGLPPIAKVGIAAMLGAALVGIIKMTAGLIAGALALTITTVLKNALYTSKAIANIGAKLAKPFVDLGKRIFRPVTKMIDAAMDSFRGMIAMFRTNTLTIVDNLKASFGKIATVFRESSIGKFVKEVMAKGAMIVSKLSGLFTWMGPAGDGLFAKVNNFFEPIKTFLGKMGAYFDKIMKFIKPISSILAKLFIPLTIFLTLKETVEGAMEGYEKDGIMGAIKGGISGAFSALIGGLLDLVKSGVSWLLESMGFDKLAGVLDEFSFVDTFKSLVDGLFGVIGSAIDGLINIFTGESVFDNITNALSGVSDMASNFLKSVLRSLLPDINADGLFEGWAAKALAKTGIYEFAGINSDTGEMIQKAPESNSNGTVSSMVNEAEAPARGGRGAYTIINNNNTDNSVKSSNSSSSATTVTNTRLEAFDANMYVMP